MYNLIVGVDEVGWGFFVGDVVIVVVVLDFVKFIKGLIDFKKFSEKKWNVLSEEIKVKVLYWSIGWVSLEEIDKLNILYVIMLVMIRVVDVLGVIFNFVCVDGNCLLVWNYFFEVVVKGDSLYVEIFVVFIIVKVECDNDMLVLYEVYF